MIYDKIRKNVWRCLLWIDVLYVVEKLVILNSTFGLGCLKKMCYETGLYAIKNLNGESL